MPSLSQPRYRGANVRFLAPQVFDFHARCLDAVRIPIRVQDAPA